MYKDVRLKGFLSSPWFISTLNKIRFRSNSSYTTLCSHIKLKYKGNWCLTNNGRRNAASRLLMMLLRMFQGDCISHSIPGNKLNFKSSLDFWKFKQSFHFSNRMGKSQNKINQTFTKLCYRPRIYSSKVKVTFIKFRL